MPSFYVTAESAATAADQAFEVVFTVQTYPSGDTLTAGVYGPGGTYDAVQVSSTA